MITKIVIKANKIFSSLEHYQFLDLIIANIKANDSMGTYFVSNSS